MNSFADRFITEVRKLRAEQKPDEIITAFKGIDNFKTWIQMLPFKTTYEIVFEYYLAAYWSKNYELASEVVTYFQYGLIDPQAVQNTDFLLQHIRKNRKIIGTFDPNRVPKEDEIVIIYGNYPMDYQHLIVNNPCRRHIQFFKNINHDLVEYDPCWEKIDQIYIISMEERSDRYLETLRELHKMKAPLHRVTKQPGVKINVSNDFSMNSAIGCSTSHLYVCLDAYQKGYNNILVLEDDFTFTDNLDKHQMDLKQFLDNYDYWICLLSYSRFYRNKAHDDLVEICNQDCTTASGYLVSREGLTKLIPVFQDGLEKLKSTGNGLAYACDRYWKQLYSSNKFFVFKHKMGFQRPNYSSRTNSVIFAMD